MRRLVREGCKQKNPEGKNCTRAEIACQAIYYLMGGRQSQEFCLAGDASVPLKRGFKVRSRATSAERSGPKNFLVTVAALRPAVISGLRSAAFSSQSCFSRVSVLSVCSRKSASYSPLHPSTGCLSAIFRNRLPRGGNIVLQTFELRKTSL